MNTTTDKIEWDVYPSNEHINETHFLIMDNVRVARIIKKKSSFPEGYVYEGHDYANDYYLDTDPDLNNLKQKLIQKYIINE